MDVSRLARLEACVDQVANSSMRLQQLTSRTRTSALTAYSTKPVYKAVVSILLGFYLTIAERNRQREREREREMVRSTHTAYTHAVIEITERNNEL